MHYFLCQPISDHNNQHLLSCPLIPVSPFWGTAPWRGHHKAGLPRHACKGLSCGLVFCLLPRPMQPVTSPDCFAGIWSECFEYSCFNISPINENGLESYPRQYLLKQRLTTRSFKTRLLFLFPNKEMSIPLLSFCLNPVHCSRHRPLAKVFSEHFSPSDPFILWLFYKLFSIFVSDISYFGCIEL